MAGKYQLRCTACGAVIKDFGEWFAKGQRCSCGCSRAEAEYDYDYSGLDTLCKGESQGLFHYFDLLPLLDRSNVITLGEGAVPLERWNFLEQYALQAYGVRCQVYISRSDLSGGTGTFKDPAAALGTSLFREWGVRRYCIASTGNTATAFSRYCREAGVDCTVFVPSDVSEDTAKVIEADGSHLVRSKGNYADAKAEAASFASSTGTLISAGNIDPIRVESKRTLVFEYLRQLGKMPDVYIQAVAGGTAPIAIDKGVRETETNCGGRVLGEKVHLPRMLLVQQDTCDPMVRGWERAVEDSFSEGWEHRYPEVEPQTAISILSTGKPGMFPIVAPIVRRSGGEFLRVEETSIVKLASWVHKEKGFIPGPASMVCIAGFLKALEQDLIDNGEVVSINMGEGSLRASAFRQSVEHYDL